jgi:hypothetical protein
VTELAGCLALSRVSREGALQHFLTVLSDRECPEPEQIPFGSVTVSERFFGARATYSCQHGYHVVGLQSRTCQADGKWAGAAPICKQNSEYKRFVASILTGSKEKYYFTLFGSPHDREIDARDRFSHPPRTNAYKTTKRDVAPDAYATFTAPQQFTLC